MTPAELDEMIASIERARESLVKGLAHMLVAAEHDAEAREITLAVIRRGRVAMLDLLAPFNNAEKVLNG